ncbi:MAG: DNA polymerase subunit beta [Cyanobacteria bacterium RI_101]|nr:DNA polymerase subunit beta [Cyanobacteria bacterium RI_101]
MSNLRDIPPQIHPPRLTQFCQDNQISQLSVFGSILRDDFTNESHIDLLVKFELGAKISVFKLIQLENELQEFLQRNVDLVPQKAIENSQNWIRRSNILDGAEVIYVQ